MDSIYNIQNTDKDENETDLYFLKDFSYAENEIDKMKKYMYIQAFMIPWELKILAQRTNFLNRNKI